MPNWMRVLRSLLDLSWESRCPLCQRSTPRPLCQDCERRLRDCQHPAPQQAWQPPLPVFVWGAYGGALKQVLARLKYANQPALAQPLGEWLGQAWAIADLAPRQPLIAVPIPLHADKQQQRGYNQAELIAQAFCQTTGLRLQRCLERVRSTEAQFGLSAEQRAQNVADAFRLSPRCRPPHPVLLVDDIYTTGATIRSAAAALSQHGIRVYGTVAVAKPLGSAAPLRTAARWSRPAHPPSQK